MLTHSSLASCCTVVAGAPSSLLHQPSPPLFLRRLRRRRRRRPSFWRLVPFPLPSSALGASEENRRERWKARKPERMVAAPYLALGLFRPGCIVNWLPRQAGHFAIVCLGHPGPLWAWPGLASVATYSYADADERARGAEAVSKRARPPVRCASPPLSSCRPVELAAPTLHIHPAPSRTPSYVAAPCSS